MQAVVLTKDFKLELVNKEIPKPSATQVRIQLSACALNRRDYWITQKMYPKVKVREEGGRPVEDNLLGTFRCSQFPFDSSSCYCQNSLIHVIFALSVIGPYNSRIRWMRKGR